MKTLYENILEGMKPGKSASQLHREAVAKITMAKIEHIPDYGMGQGIGLSLKEPPLIAQGDRTVFAEEMCFTLRLAVRDKDLGAVMIGNTVYLSGKEAELLTL